MGKRYGKISVLYYTIVFIKLHYYKGQNVIILHDTFKEVAVGRFQFLVGQSTVNELLNF